MPLNTTIFSPERYKSKYPGGSCGGFYCPRNASPAMTGNQTMWSAFGESANTYFIQLEERVGVKAAVQAAEKLGVVFRDTQQDQVNRKAALASDKAWGAFTLGVAQVTPLDMANAYATVAARGKYCKPLPVLKILDRDGKLVPQTNPTCQQVIPQQVADAATDAARCPVGDDAMSACTHPGGGRTASRVAQIPGQVAGKSGTTDGDNGTPTAWLAGFTPTMAGAAFVANPKKANDSVDHLTRRPADIFIDTMTAAVKGVPKKSFVKPTEAMAFGVRVTVPDVDGDSVAEAEATLSQAGFLPQVEQRRLGSDEPAGTVVRTDPDGGSRYSKGSVVKIFVSNGTDRDDEPVFDPNQPGAVDPNTGDNGNGRPGREPEDPPTPED
jgi:membrane peptidoglycan carboxypeptidase